VIYTAKRWAEAVGNGDKLTVVTLAIGTEKAVRLHLPHCVRKSGDWARAIEINDGETVRDAYARGLKDGGFIEEKHKEDA